MPFTVIKPCENKQGIRIITVRKEYIYEGCGRWKVKDAVEGVEQPIEFKDIPKHVIEYFTEWINSNV